MESRMIRKALIVVLCVSFTFLLVTSVAVAKEKVLVMGHGAEASSLFPMASDQAAQDRIHCVSEAMSSIDEDGKPIPALATSWEVVDGKKWRFHLRKGVKFHSGEDFTAEDVAFSINTCQDPKTKCARRGVLKGYRVEIVDDYTVDIISDKGAVDPILPPAWYCIRILPKDTFTKMGIEKFSRATVGTGAFQVVEWKEGEHLILKAFDNYWGGRPKIDKIIIKTVPEAAARVIGLKTGKLDVITNVPPEEVKSIDEDPNLEIVKKPSLWVMHHQFRCDAPPFKDNINLRKAVAHAIDSKTICDTILGGFGTPVATVTPPLAFGYNENLKLHKYDPELAKEFLKKAGYKGEKIKMITSNGRYFMDIDVNSAVAGYLKAIGMNIELILSDWPTWINKWSNKKIESIFLIGWCDNSGDGVENIYDVAHGNSNYHWLPKGGIKEVNEQIDIAKSSLDSNVRKAAIQKADEILHNYYYWAMCFAPIKVYGVKKGVGWTPRADETFNVTVDDDVP